MRFSITIGFASLAVGLAMSQQTENDLVTRQTKPAPPTGPTSNQPPPDKKPDPAACAAIMKRLEAAQGGGGGAGGPPGGGSGGGTGGGSGGRSSRRGISESHNDALSNSLTRRAPPAGGDQKATSETQAPADSCDKLSAMIKARQAGAGPKSKPTRRDAMEVPYTMVRRESAATNASSTVPPTETPPAPGGTSTIPANNATGNGSSIAPPKPSPKGKAKPTRRDAMEVPYTMVRRESAATNASSTVPPTGTPPAPGGTSTIPANNATGNGSSIAPPKPSPKGKAKPTRRDAMEVPYTMVRRQSAATNASSTVPPTGTPPAPGGTSTIPANNATGNGSSIAPPKASPTGKSPSPSRRDVYENEHHLNSRQTTSAGTTATDVANKDPKVCAAILKKMEAAKAASADATKDTTKAPTRRGLSGRARQALARRSPQAPPKPNAGSDDPCARLTAIDVLSIHIVNS
ncbi:uncharacterized protein MELLADRAFT_110815 [Melampsora larici-populina 98AG31]|uniref:Secreted protein n=1 Tax=Melampsora larici-populina (strain 98AG31 / pathotype 3-4-7) TaxID=747676 RepID=F4S125_MELLP|nr:uncharacterized protein MELLADRAFT_110815 [Melampsora larici-populina 98AG31]EGG01696.1 hypothetical protein MELLADRAFT_110815 [Melampsora larici-populina 98AG31]